MMKGSKILLQWMRGLIALLVLHQSSVAVSGSKLPPIYQLQALTDLAKANGQTKLARGDLLQSWNISWNPQKNWTGGNPCANRTQGGFQGVVCWSTGAIMKLSLAQSGLQGPISPALGKLNSLNRVFLNDNKLSGEVVPLIRNLRWLRRLKLARNSFTGEVPNGTFTNLKNLTTLDMSQNKFSGILPSDLFTLPSLQNLSLSGNNFSGRLPAAISLKSALNIVDLSNNALYGKLPTFWATSNLTYIDLSGNSLSGPLPQQLLNLTTVKLNFANNNFSGNVTVAQSKTFGCAAFAGNPGLVMLDPACNSSSKKGLSTLVIVALAVADVAFVLITLVGCVVFFLWWKKRKDSVKVGTSWPDTSKEGERHSQDGKASFTTSIDIDPEQNVVKSDPATKLDVKPALKSVVGKVTDPSNNSMTREGSIEQSFSSLEQSFSVKDFTAKIVLLDATLSLEFEDLLSAKALVLGAGSVGIVYMACLEDGHMLAIKRIEELTLTDQKLFGRQCGKLAEVLHPNLLQLRAYCWAQEKLLIFDYMRNGSVHSLLHEKDGSSADSEKVADWATRLKIAVGTARAVAHLHDSDMVHGNIKAKNVLLDEQYEPRLSDFGLETLLQIPLEHSMGANNGYLAPEVANSRPRRRTQEGDVYSLGVLLLELLTGRQPDGDYDGGLPGWVQDMTQEKRSMELFDSSLVSMLNFPSAQDILEFIGLARACVSRDATARPSVTIVLRTLESIVPGSTAPRSYVKDDNFDSDASISYRETTTNPFLTSYDAIPAKDDARDGDDEDGF